MWGTSTYKKINLKRPIYLYSKDGRPHSKVLSYSSSSESLKKDLLDMRSDAQKQRMEQSEKRDSEDSGFRSINEFDGDREQKALEDISNKARKFLFHFLFFWAVLVFNYLMFQLISSSPLGTFSQDP